MTTKTEEQLKMIQTLGISRTKGRRKKWKWIIALAVLAIVAVAIFSLGKKNKMVASDYYKTKAVERSALTVTVTATGSLQPTNQVDVGSEQSGIVKTVDVTYNDRVKVGQVLARLDPTILEAQVMQSKANLESARASVLSSQATVTETRNKMKRLQDVWELSGKKVPSREELDAAEAALQRAVAAEATARAQVSVAEATLDAKETDLSKLIIYSPVDGIVLDRKVEPGQTVQASFQAVTLFTLAEDLSRMELHVDVDEADVGLVKEGQSASFTVDAFPDRTFEAEVIQVRFGAKTEQGVVTYETVLTADNRDLLLRPGMTATADIVVNKIDGALLIPNAALRFSPTKEELKRFSEKMNEPAAPKDKEEVPKTAAREQQKVWVLQSGKIVQVPITIGETDSINTEVKGGDLKSGDLLVTSTVSKEK